MFMAEGGGCKKASWYKMVSSQFVGAPLPRWLDDSSLKHKRWENGNHGRRHKSRVCVFSSHSCIGSCEATSAAYTETAHRILSVSRHSFGQDTVKNYEPVGRPWLATTRRPRQTHSEPCSSTSVHACITLQKFRNQNTRPITARLQAT